MSGRVVVGIDGSDTSRRAARWAAHEARLRGAKLEIVSAWHVPLYGYAHVGSVTAISEDIVKGLIENAEGHLAEVAREAQVEAGGIALETIAAEGQPANVLLKISEGADLLVVGSRGLGGFRELLLGSVSQQCAQHASCPVVIIRHLDGAA
jgi:nucleotide-binding universal stress UspA family protein